MYCGGRTPTDDAIDVYRSVLSMGQAKGIDDGVDRDDHEHSTSGLSVPGGAMKATGHRRCARRC